MESKEITQTGNTEFMSLVYEVCNTADKDQLHMLLAEATMRLGKAIQLLDRQTSALHKLKCCLEMAHEIIDEQDELLNTNVGELLKQNRLFVYVADDAPFFEEIFSLVRDYSIQLHAWTHDDEARFRTFHDATDAPESPQEPE